MADDPFHLQRFLMAQQGIYDQARAELADGRKRSHWMWFIFPQLQGLGSSPMAQRYAIADLAEARAYLDHIVLGVRLRDCTALVNAVEGSTIEEIFGYPDDLKFHSSVTLFAQAARESAEDVFSAALAKFWNGASDAATLELLPRLA